MALACVPQAITEQPKHPNPFNAQPVTGHAKHAQAVQHQIASHVGKTQHCPTKPAPVHPLITIQTQHPYHAHHAINPVQAAQAHPQPTAQVVAPTLIYPHPTIVYAKTGIISTQTHTTVQLVTRIAKLAHQELFLPVSPAQPTTLTYQGPPVSARTGTEQCQLTR